MMAKPGRPLGIHRVIQRRPPLSPHSRERGKNAARTDQMELLALALGAPGPFGQPHRPADDAILEVLVGDVVLAGPDLAARATVSFEGSAHRYTYAFPPAPRRWAFLSDLELQLDDPASAFPACQVT